jgi:hypothetical protein
MIHQINVAPVGAVQVPPATVSGLPTAAFLPMGILQSLVGKEPSKFSGRSVDWPTWRRKWLGYVKEVEGLYVNINSRQKLALLRNWVDQASAEMLDDEQQRNPELSYDVYRLDLSFGAEDKEGMRRQLRSLRLKTQGKVDEQQWREFAAKAICLA